MPLDNTEIPAETDHAEKPLSLGERAQLQQLLNVALPDPAIRAMVAGLLGKSGTRRAGMKAEDIIAMAQEVLEGRKEGDDGLATAGSILELLKRRLGVGNQIHDDEIDAVTPLGEADAKDPQQMIAAVTAMAQAEGAQNVLKRLMPGQTIRKTEQAVGRNDVCPCGSGKKFKKCCMKKK